MKAKNTLEIGKRYYINAKKTASGVYIGIRQDTGGNMFGSIEGTHKLTEYEDKPGIIGFCHSHGFQEVTP